MRQDSPEPKKSLGQHWLNDTGALTAVCEAANLDSDDVVLEIGPGMGSLTRHLTKLTKQVIAVELDPLLAAMLVNRVKSDNLTVIEGDILRFDFTQLPPSYKIVANIPYYLTSHLLRVLYESPHPPNLAVLLVQKEVAERAAAQPGQMGLLSVSLQLHCEVSLADVIPAELFKPPPKVDSQILVLERREKPLFNKLDQKQFFQIVKAGFSERRKKLRGSLSGGLHISKPEADQLLLKADINGELRAQNLSLNEWHKLYLAYFK